MHSYTPLRLLGLALLLMAWTGCSDSLSGIEPDEAAPETPAAMSFEHIDKLRNAHLLEQAYGEFTPSAGDSMRTEGLLGSLLDPVLEPVLEPKTVQLFVGMEDSSYDANKMFRRYKLFRRYEYRDAINAVFVEVEVGILSNLLSYLNVLPNVLWIEPAATLDFILEPVRQVGTASEGTPWGVERIGGTTSWAAAGDGKGRVEGVDLYVLDSGVNPGDMNLVSQVDFTSSGTAADVDGHGYHAAGTAGALDDDAFVVGVAPGVDVHGIKVLNDEGGTPMWQIIAGIDYVAKQKRKNPRRPVVANLSLGANMGTTEYNALDLAVQGAIEKGVTVVVAAGNDGIDASLVSPAHVHDAITVGAYDQLDRFAWFSNHGPRVDLLAPGVEITSLARDWKGNTTLAVMSGTSMAAPHVAGAAALYLAQHPTATPQQVRDALVHSGRAEIGGVPRGTTKTTVYVGGSGLASR